MTKDIEGLAGRVVDALDGVVEHKPNCKVYHPSAGCSCGLIAALAELTKYVAPSRLAPPPSDWAVEIKKIVDRVLSERVEAALTALSELEIRNRERAQHARA